LQAMINKKKRNVWMKRMTPYAVILLIAIVSLPTLRAQVVLDEWDDIVNKLRLNKQLDPSSRNLYDQVEGNPYLYNGELQGGTITIRGQGTYKGKFRYDISANEIQFLQNGVIQAIADPGIIDSVTIGDYTLIYALTDVQKGRGSYFGLVLDGKCKLLAKKEVDFIEAVPAKAYSDPKPARFDRDEDTYYMVKDHREAFKINRRNIRDVLSDQLEKIEQYIKEENLSYSSREDMMKLITFYNSL
jgi:hypothetical protein